MASLASLESYFVGHARPWERYAWLKARAITGSADARSRRWCGRSSTAATSTTACSRRCASCTARIFEAAIAAPQGRRHQGGRRRHPRGRVRGAAASRWCAAGATASCRPPSTREALARARSRAALIEPARGAALARGLRIPAHARASAAVLRRPADAGAAARARASRGDRRGDGHARLRRRCCASSIAIARWCRKPSTRSSSGHAASAPAASLAARLNDPQAAPDAEGLAEDLARRRASPSRAGWPQRLIEFTRSRRYRALSAASRAQASRRCCRTIVEAAAREGGTPRPPRSRLLELIEAIDRREAYLALLVEYPQVLARAARLVARSALGGAPARAPSDPARRAHAHGGELHRHRLEGRARMAAPRDCAEAERRHRAHPRPAAPLQAAPRAAPHHRRHRGRARR